MTDVSTGHEPSQLDTRAYPLHRRTVDVFLSPGRLFETFRDDAPWFGALAVAVIVGIGMMLLVPQELFVEQAREAVRQGAERGTSMPSAEQIAVFGRLAGIAGVAFGTPIMAFVVAGVLALVFSVLGGGSARYGQYLAVTTHAMLITAVGGMLTLPIQIIRGDLNARLALSLFAPAFDSGSALYRVLHGLEIFTLWSLVVTGLGVAVINRRGGAAGSVAIVVGIYVVALVAIAMVAP